MRLRSAILNAVAALAAVSPTAATPSAATVGTPAGAPRAPQLRPVHSFAFAIGTGDLAGDAARRLGAYDLVVVDGQEATLALVRALRSGGTIVLAYLSVGTIEPGRPWYGQVKPFRLDFWPDFGEFYAATSKRGYRDAITGRVAPSLLRKGFDGLFLDNTDMIEGHPRQAAGMRNLVGRLSRLVHRRGGLLFSQNGDDSFARTAALYDGWNREDVSSTYDFGRHRYVAQPPDEVAGAVRALRRYSARGLLVTATDYARAGDATTQSRAVATACAAGALPFVSDIGLRRLPAIPLRCVSQ